MAKVQAWLIWKKIVSPAADQLDTELPAQLPHELDVAFHSVNFIGRRSHLLGGAGISTSARGIPGNLFGHLIATTGDPKLAFVARRRWRNVAVELELDTYKVAHEPKFLSENVVLYSLEKKPKYNFPFPPQPAVRSSRHWSAPSRNVLRKPVAVAELPAEPPVKPKSRWRPPS